MATLGTSHRIQGDAKGGGSSGFYFKTTREAPSEASDVISHGLLVRGGFIQQIAAGIFNLMPLGFRSAEKIKRIIREEMNAAGALETTMPVVQPRSIWEESGRADSFVPPLSSFDVAGRSMVLAPTHEETVSIMARSAISSYRDMPLNLYQIQTKFRNEPRPRGGLLRTREFEMKDAYSFDADQAGLDASYDAMAHAYRQIFRRCGLNAVMVQADSGPIGGKDSAEFVLVADSGEDLILQCADASCDYAANVEKAEFRKSINPAEDELEIEKFATPGVTTIEALADMEGVLASKTAKVVFYTIRGRVHVVVIRGDYEVNETKLRNVTGGDDVRLATADEVSDAGFVPGSASAIGVDSSLVVADDSATTSSNLLAGANEEGFHLRNVNYGRDWTAGIVTDIAEAAAGAICCECGESRLRADRGIEVGHIFKLGTVYSAKMNIRFDSPDGERREVLMGCYGIGVGRLLAAAVEANHDGYGMMLPVAIAPFEVALVPISMQSNVEVRATAETVFEELTAAGIEVLMDDRDEAPGVKFADADLIGLPVRLVVSPRSLKRGAIELKARSAPASDASDVQIAEVVGRVRSMLRE